MKTKKIEVVHTTYNEVYVAVDGTEFDNEQECKLYENSAKCALRAAIKDIAIKKSNAYSCFPGGNDDNEVIVVIPKTDEDIRNLRQYEAFIQQKYDRNFSEEHSHVKAEHKGKVLVVIIGYDEDWVDIRELGAIVEFATDGKYELVEKK